MDIDNKKNGQCPKGNWSQNCPSMSSRMFLLSWISAKHMCSEASNKRKVSGEPLEPLPRCTPRGFRTTFDQLIVTWSGWSGWRKHPTKMASPKTVWPTRKPKGFAIFSAPQPNSERMVKTLHGCGNLSRTGWRTGEEVPVGAGILIKSFMRGNSEELIRNLHFTF